MQGGAHAFSAVGLPVVSKRPGGRARLPVGKSGQAAVSGRQGTLAGPTAALSPSSSGWPGSWGHSPCVTDGRKGIWQSLEEWFRSLQAAEAVNEAIEMSFPLASPAAAPVLAHTYCAQ